MADVVNLNANSTFRNTPKYSFTSSSTTSKDKDSKAPGPGQYLMTNVDKDKFSKSPAFVFSSGKSDSKWAAMPGPGAYSPVDAGFVSPKWMFTNGDRLKPLKKSTTPGPGQYDTRGKTEGQEVSFPGKPEAKLGRSLTPGPGTYKINYEPLSCYASSPSIGFGASNRGKMTMSKTPGPGSYEHLTSVGAGNCVMKNPGSFSIKGRYAQPKADQTPGPIAAGTTFCR
mmetsp:Transcript_5465/g.8867  ORF Transcript_5465/g.8867 Transcript_5465/m.8867 type:complete len:226 (+) Transcript_5465:108-785(+)